MVLQGGFLAETSLPVLMMTMMSYVPFLSMITPCDVVLRGGFKAETSLPAVDDDGGENPKFPNGAFVGEPLYLFCASTALR